MTYARSTVDHVGGWDPYDMYDAAHVFWVGIVLQTQILPNMP